MLSCLYSTKNELEKMNERKSAMVPKLNWICKRRGLLGLKVHKKEKQGLLQEKTKGLLHLCRMWAGDRRRQKQPGKGAGQRPPG